MLLREWDQRGESTGAYLPAVFVALSFSGSGKTNHVGHLRRSGQRDGALVRRNQPGVVLDAIEPIGETILRMRNRCVSHRAKEAVAWRHRPVFWLEQIHTLHAELLTHLTEL